MPVDLNAVLAAHRGNVGFQDGETDNNPWGPVQGITNAPYCDSAASVVPWQNGYRWWPESQCAEKGCAYCQYHINVGKAHGEFAYDHESTGSPVDVLAGDLLFYGWKNGAEPADHVETAIEDSPSGRTHNIGYNTGAPKGCHDLWRDRKYLIGRLRPSQYSDAPAAPVVAPAPPVGTVTEVTGQPLDMYDGVTWQGLPADAQVAAGYARHRFTWPAAAWQRFSGLWLPIDVYVPGSGDDPRQAARDTAAYARAIGLPVGVSIVLDVEAGNAQQAHDEGYTNNWSDEIRKGGDSPAVYTSQSTQHILASDGFDDMWGAQYDGVKHINPGDAATQYASPDTGSGGQWDKSLTNGNFPRRPGGRIVIQVNPPVVAPPQPATGPDGNPFTLLDVDGDFGNHTIHATQWKIGTPADGIFGHNSDVALQQHLGVAADGAIGPITIRALQARVGATQDGQWGPLTTKALQTALNAGSF